MTTAPPLNHGHATTPQQRVRDVLTGVARDREQKQAALVDEYLELLGRLARDEDLQPDQAQRLGEVCEHFGITSNQVAADVAAIAQAHASHVPPERLETLRQTAIEAADKRRDRGAEVKRRIVELQDELRELAEREEQTAADLANAEQNAGTLDTFTANVRQRLARRST